MNDDNLDDLENTETDATEALSDDEDVEDFDAFWTTRTRKGRKLKVFGETVELPPALPLQYEVEARRLQRSKSTGDVMKLLRILLPDGDALVQRWSEKGMDSEQFAVLLAYLPAKVMGHKITLPEVADAVAEQTKKAMTGKAPAARRRNSSRKPTTGNS